MDQELILVDENDKILGYAPKQECHLGEGLHHRAFVVMVKDGAGRVLLQKRKHKLFDGFWDLTAISHPLHLIDHDETYQEASDRALKKEMGVGSVKVEKLGAFNYFAKDGKDCENEYCAVLVGTYDGKINPNFEEVYEVKRVLFEDFLSDIEADPAKYTPWAVLASKILKKEFG